MPKENSDSITIRTDTYKLAADDAKSEHRSLANYIHHLILQEHEFKKQSKKIREKIRRV